MVGDLTEVYRGHQISLSREDSLGGDELLYYGIYRTSDWFECAAGFTSDESDLPTYMGYMRERVDNELSSPDPWGENETI